MAKSYLVTVHDDKVTGTQVMKALQKLGCFVEMKDLPNGERLLTRRAADVCHVCGAHLPPITLRCVVCGTRR